MPAMAHLLCLEMLAEGHVMPRDRRATRSVTNEKGPPLADSGQMPAKESPKGAEAFKKPRDSLHPIAHAGEPDNSAHGAPHLVSDEAKF